MTNSDLPATIARLRESLPGPDRCRVCGWLLSSRGCRIGDCSYRPSARGQPDDGLWRQRVMVRADDIAAILDALDTRATDERTALDAIARALHPHWEGDGHTCIPDVRTLLVDAASAIRELRATRDSLIAMLTAERDALREVAKARERLERLLHNECAKCSAMLVDLPLEPPHCDDCVVDGDTRCDWEHDVAEALLEIEKGKKKK